MITIGICDDSDIDRKIIYEEVSRIIFQYEEVRFVYYSSGQEVIEEIEENKFLCELLFLDINMPYATGLETAEYIRKHSVDVDIIFITVAKEHVFDGYTYQAFSYLLKPIDKERLSDEMSRYITIRNTSSQCLHVMIDRRKEQIFLDRVKYFVCSGRKIYICQRGEKEKLSFYAKVSELEEMLPKNDFIRCHQSYLVNKNYIQSYTRTELEIGDEMIPISRRYTEEVRRLLEKERL